jgi:hypothetical protein
MKLTKAKGLNADLGLSSGYNPRAASIQLMRSLAAEATHPRKPVRRTELASFVVCCHGSEPDRTSPFALATFIWGRK